MTASGDTTIRTTRDTSVNATPKKKLIETSLPLEVINRETQREGKIRQSKPATFHHWWARRPHVNTRAVLFAQLVDDPSSRPEDFPTLDDQATERSRLHSILERLVVWENSNDRGLLDEARAEILRSNGGEMPALLDPFAGGGTIPLEAQRLGLEAHASDLNPIPVLINRALVDIPARFSDLSPIHPEAQQRTTPWLKGEGLAEDVIRYGEDLRREAEHRIGNMYPKVVAPDGTKHTVIAWIWARTVRSPNPANPIEVPIVNSWQVSKKKGNEHFVEPLVESGTIRYEVHRGPASEAAKAGTRIGRGVESVADGTPISAEYIKSEGQAGRMGVHLIAVVAEGDRGRLYFTPDGSQLEAANVDRPADVPDEDLPFDPRNVWTPPYGLTRFSDLFTNRQLHLLTTLTDLVGKIRDRAAEDARSSGMSAGKRLEDGGRGAEAYADAIATYLAMAIDKLADLNNALCRWEPQAECPRNLFNRQTIPMVWDFAESNPFSHSSGSLSVILRGFAGAFRGYAFSSADTPAGDIRQANAVQRDYEGLAVSTDPPYYDNINYGDLSDFFYVWLRRSLRDVQPSLVSTLLTPKADELVANQYRHGGRAGAEHFFVTGFNAVFERIRETANTNIPMTVYYAYKQQDSGVSGTSSVGWHTLLDGLVRTGWEVTATWPMHTEGSGRMIAQGTNALASSIVLACRPRPNDAPTTTRRAFVAALRSELPEALRTLIQGSISAVDLDQAAIGPGIAVYSRYARVRESDGTDMSVKDALELINVTLDEVVDELSGADPDSRFAAKWYRQFGWGSEASGTAITMAQSAGTSLGNLERGGIFEAKGGKARLLPPTALTDAWDVQANDRVSVWEATVRLASVMSTQGADGVAQQLSAVGERVSLEAVKEMTLWLFREAEKKRDTKDAILFNGLVSAWGDVNEQARKLAGAPRAVQQAFDFDEDGD